MKIVFLLTFQILAILFIESNAQGQPYNPGKAKGLKPVIKAPKKPLSNVKHGFQAPGISREIDRLKGSLKTMKPNFLKSQLKERPNNAARENKDGFHFMKKGSALDGYFTMDVKDPDSSDDSRGRMRLLFRTKPDNIRESDVIGLVDTHNKYNKYDENVKPWNKVKPSETKEFTKIRNANNEDIGVRLINTFSNRKPGVPLTKPPPTKWHDTRKIKPS
jgi:hypothetical protein